MTLRARLIAISVAAVTHNASAGNVRVSGGNSADFAIHDRAERGKWPGMLTRRQFGGLLGASLLPGIAHATPARSTLFTIARSKNKNVVRYRARLRQDALDPAQPVEAHWLMLAEDGRREELTWAERQLAYGFSVSAVSTDGCQLGLVAFKTRAISVERIASGFCAKVSIAGERARLERIFVQTREGVLMPSVVHVELYGTRADGESLRERIVAR